MSWNTPLTGTQRWLLCSAALLLQIVPLLMADLPALDDYARQQLARNDWEAVGRPLAVTMHMLFSFGADAVNVYPLPLIVATLVAAHALACLARHWFGLPTASAVLVVLPLWMQPMFLQNLSYQYDSASMALALVLSVWAIILGRAWPARFLLGSLLVALGAALYQPTVNVFAGLCCIEVMRQVMDGHRLARICRYAALRLGQLLVGCGFYYFTCNWMVLRRRAELLAVDDHWPAAILRHLAATAEVVNLLITPWIFWGAIGLGILALGGLGRQIRIVWLQPYGAGERLGLVAFLLLPMALLVLCVPGVMLVLRDFSPDPRALMGLGAVLALLLYLVHDALSALPRLRLGVLVLTAVAMLSVSFAYGRVLLWQKTLLQSVSQSVAHDLSSLPARQYYLLDYWQARLWLPAAKGTLRNLPVLERINPNNFVMLPEMLPLVGIDQLHTFYQPPPLSREQVLAASPSPQLVRQLYDIHLLGDAAYVLFKVPPAPAGGH
ncbi:TPA: glucosyltransferase domain-containing protein [Pseudomonas putida]|nr:glucosyltransferase domain-containing protein [Pseudomonas putida]